jgi:hypothetical protein
MGEGPITPILSKVSQYTKELRSKQVNEAEREKLFAEKKRKSKKLASPPSGSVTAQ